MSISSIPATPQTCLICNAPLSFDRARMDRLCGRGECDWRYALLRRQNRVCTVCGRPLATSESAAQVCAAPACRRAAVEDIAQRGQERNQARWEALIQQEIEQAKQLRDRVITAFGVEKPESFPLVVIPAFTAKLVNLPERRRRNFRDHLNTLIGQAAILPDTVPAADREYAASSGLGSTPEAKTVMGMACACCKGLCCEGGGDHAYLDVATVRRYMAEHPDQRPRDVLAAYMDRVGRRTYEGSCIFHQSDGCALSRDMRADLCNRHYCKALGEFRQNLPTEGPVRAFFVSAHYGVVHAAALAHGDQMLVVQGVPPPQASTPTGE